MEGRISRTTALLPADTDHLFTGREPSLIEPHEEEVARKLMLDNFQNLTGVRMTPKPCGYYICVRIYVRDEEWKTVTADDGSKKTIYIPDASLRRDKFDSVAACVVALGPDAYKDPVRYPNGAWCKVGDWVAIPRYENFPIMYRGVALAFLPDDKIITVIDDPAVVQATYVAAQV